LERNKPEVFIDLRLLNLSCYHVQVFSQKDNEKSVKIQMFEENAKINMILKYGRRTNLNTF